MLNERGAQRALAAGIDHLQFVFSVSEPHNLANAGCTVEESVRRLESIIAALDSPATIEVTLATAFGCPFAGPVRPDRVVTLAEAVLALDVSGISLADTIGTGSPSEVRRLTSKVVGVAGGSRVGVHLHDARGMVFANTLVAVDAGVGHVDASLGGLGGCPFAPGASGNLPIEDLVHGLDAEGIRTGVDVEAARAGRLMTEHIALGCDAVVAGWPSAHGDRDGG